MWTGQPIESVLIVPAHPMGCLEEARDVMASTAVASDHAIRQQGDFSDFVSHHVFGLVVHSSACGQNCCRYRSVNEDKLARTAGKWAGFE